jgi:SNF2 family DNA or RNA helicase
VIEVTRVGDRIYLRFPYSAELVDRCRALRGSWSASQKVWTFPLTLDVCRLLRAEFGEALEIRPALWSWARAEARKESEMAELGAKLSGVDLVRIPERYPVLAEAMESRPYQHAAARFIAEGRSVLVSDGMGLGKTLEALAGVVESGVPGPYLVVAPQVALDTAWEREILSRLDDAEVYTVGLKQYNRPKRTEMLSDAIPLNSSLTSWDDRNVWVLINIEMVRTKSFWVCPTCGMEWPKSDHPKSQIIDCGHDPGKVRIRHAHEYPQLFGLEWGAVIMDECQRALIRNSGTPTQTRNGAKLLRVREDGLRIALSGTPMRGKPQRLWGTLNWLNEKAYSGFWGWLERFWEVTQEGYAGSRSIGRLIPEREATLNASLSRYVLRRTKQEVSPELPPKQYCGTPLTPGDPDSPTGVWLEMDPAQAKAYEQMLVMGSADVNGGTINAVGVLAEMTRLKQFASSAGMVGAKGFQPAFPSNKFDWTLQWLVDAGILDYSGRSKTPTPGDEPQGKVVIASQFTGLLKLFQDQLESYGLRTLAITGEVTGPKRTMAQDLFNDPSSDYHVLFINTTAGGVAITLDAADDMIILDETHIPDDQEQLEDRINNRRPEERVATRRFWYLKSLGTIDEAVARVNIQRDKSQKRILDERRGVAYLREVVETAKALREKGHRR